MEARRVRELLGLEYYTCKDVAGDLLNSVLLRGTFEWVKDLDYFLYGL